MRNLRASDRFEGLLSVGNPGGLPKNPSADLGSLVGRGRLAIALTKLSRISFLVPGVILVTKGSQDGLETIRFDLK